MPTTLPEGIVIPAGGDSYNLVADLRTMAESTTTIVPVANVTARTALVSALTTAGRAPSTTDPVYVDRADAPLGFSLECDRGGGFFSVSGGSRFRYVVPTAIGSLSGNVDLAATQEIPASPFGARPYWLRISGAAVMNCPIGVKGTVETLIDGSAWDYAELSSGSGTIQGSIRCNRPYLITNYAIAHTARVRLGSESGSSVVLGPGRIFDIELTPATELL